MATPTHAGNTASYGTIARPHGLLSNADERSSILDGLAASEYIQATERFIRSLLRQHWQQCGTGTVPGKQRGPSPGDPE